MQKELFYFSEQGHADLKQAFRIQERPTGFAPNVKLHCHPVLLCQGALGILRKLPQFRLFLLGQLLRTKSVFPAEIGRNRLVDIISTQMVVPCHGNDFNHIVKAFHIGQIQSTAPEVKDQEGSVLLAVFLPVGQGRRRGLVDKALHLKPGNLGRLSGIAALPVIEIGGNRYDGLLYLFLQVKFRVPFYLLQDHG